MLAEVPAAESKYRSFLSRQIDSCQKPGKPAIKADPVDKSIVSSVIHNGQPVAGTYCLVPRSLSEISWTSI